MDFLLDALDEVAAEVFSSVAHLEQFIDGSDAWSLRRRDELARSLCSKPGLRRTKAGLLRVDHTAIRRKAHLKTGAPENATTDTWRNVRQELDRLHLVTSPR